MAGSVGKEACHTSLESDLWNHINRRATNPTELSSLLCELHRFGCGTHPQAIMPTHYNKFKKNLYS